MSEDELPVVSMNEVWLDTKGVTALTKVSSLIIKRWVRDGLINLYIPPGTVRPVHRYKLSEVQALMNKGFVRDARFKQ